MFWFNFFDLLRGRKYRVVRLIGSTRLKKMKGIIGVRFIRQQKVFGKAGKSVLKTKSNSLLKRLRISVLTGQIQNVPPINTVLSFYGVNSQKFCEELILFLKERFCEGISVILVVNIYRDCSFKFFLLGFKRFFLLQSLYSGWTSALKFYFLCLGYWGEKAYYVQDIWLFFFIYFRLVSGCRIESFLRVQWSVIKTFPIVRLKSFIVKNEN